MRLDTAQVRHAAAALGEYGTGLAALHARIAALEGMPVAGGAEPLGAPLGAAYGAALDAALAVVGALAAAACSAGRDLAGVAARTEHADAGAAAAFPQGAG
jgi:hypothetical protein